MEAGTILWRGIQFPGYEACRVYSEASQWHLEGTAVISYDKAPCQLHYQITCDAGWYTKSAKVEGWVGNRDINIHIDVDTSQQWRLNNEEIPGVAGCIDLDLNFSPSTNTIAICRLNLPLGEHKEITAAWLRFPSFSLEPLQQSYSRLGDYLYRYESGGGSFLADLSMDPAGLVVDYPGVWIKEDK